MAKKTSKGNSAIYRTGRTSASLDHWVGPTQHLGDGVSTDPKMREGYFQGVKRQQGEEAGGKPRVEIE